MTHAIWLTGAAITLVVAVPIGMHAYRKAALRRDRQLAEFTDMRGGTYTARERQRGEVRHADPA